ncbi:hypothetical protein B296_00038923 [Ensete ventricosum]|uniref:Uncharacterized protein n=1 Tax=Ensete ventricosum TaxID=4639 RepID=A0A426ZUY6_ENSVE|nr:hypothetical protein B296_00038923 [Ensete ventricosum]
MFIGSSLKSPLTICFSISKGLLELLGAMRSVTQNLCSVYPSRDLRWSKRLPKTWKGIKDGEESPVFPWGIGGHSGSSSSSSSSRDRVRRPPPTGSCGPRTQQKEEEEAEKVDQRGEETDLRGGGDEKGDEEAGKEEDDAQEEGSGQPYLLAYQPRQQGRPGPSVSLHRGGRGGIFLPVSSDGKGSKRRVVDDREREERTK